MLFVPFSFSSLFLSKKMPWECDGWTKRFEAREKRQHKLYICVFKARPHILTRTHEMQIYYSIVIGRTPHFLSPYMLKKWVVVWKISFFIFFLLKLIFSHFSSISIHFAYIQNIPFANQLNANPSKNRETRTHFAPQSLSALKKKNAKKRINGKSERIKNLLGLLLARNATA